MEDDVYIWMQKRETLDELQGKLEFPGGKIEKDETPILAAIREVQEEVSVSLSDDELELATIFENKLVDKIINLYVFICHSSFKFQDTESSKWFPYGKKESFWLDIPPANQSFLDDIINNIKLST